MKSEALGGRALFIGHANVRENFQAADVNLIVHANRNLAETHAAASANPRELRAADFVEVKDHRAGWGSLTIHSFRLVLHETENHYRPP